MANEVILTGGGINADVFGQVDRTHRALRVSLRPWEHADGGHYRIASRSGALTGAAVVAGAPLFSLRWSPAANIRLALLRLKACWVPTVAFTGIQELGLDLIRVTSFTTSDSAGTSITPSALNDRAMPQSSVTDSRIAAATLLTAGTRTLDTTSVIEVGGGLVNVFNAAAATQYVNPTEGGGQAAFGFDYDPLSRGEMPLILTQNEGFLVRNTVIFPAAGTATLIIVAHTVEFSNPSSLIIAP